MRSVFVVVVVFGLIILGPLAVLWALNTIFPSLAIPYNLDTWCAVIVLKGFALSTISYKK
jgi:hypothetical protein